MSAITKIQWTAMPGFVPRSWNPTRGCREVSPGCANCYAREIAARFSRSGLPFHGYAERRPGGKSVWTGKIDLLPDAIGEPLSWRKPSCIFVNSMSDLFADELSNEAIAAVFGVMAVTPRHRYLILTKRAQRMRQWFEWLMTFETPLPFKESRTCILAASKILRERFARHLAPASDEVAWPPPNVALGVSAENQERADAQIVELLLTPAAVRFVSYEPALEAVDFGMDVATCKCCRRWGGRWIRLPRRVRSDIPFLADPKCKADPGIYRAHSNPHGALSVPTPGGLLGVKPDEFEVLGQPDWIIYGGESGRRARPADVAWARFAVSQGKLAGVPVFLKQMGTHVVWDGIQGGGISPWPRATGSFDTGLGNFRKHLVDRKGGDPSEWPEDLRIREFPVWPKSP